jgi:hypothetical protein
MYSGSLYKIAHATGGPWALLTALLQLVLNGPLKLCE